MMETLLMMVKAFVVGGALCVIGQLFIDLTKLTPARILVTYVVSGAFAFTVDGVTRTVHAGDTILKEDGVAHGCVCTEAGILLDIFTPMREDFVK